MKNDFLYSYGVLLFASTLSLYAILLTPSCTPQAQTAAINDGLKIALCVAQNQDLPPEQVLVKCAVENVKTEDILNLLGETRKATARAATKAGACETNQTDAGAKGGK